MAFSDEKQWEMESHGDTDDIPQPRANKRQRISLHLLARRNLPPSIHDSGDQEVITEKLNELTHVRLDRENITDIDGLELLGPAVKCLYLHKNAITIIENLECLQNLKFLTLQHNKIKCIENLRMLNHLGFLDLTSNLIEDYSEDELPKSLVILSLKDNPCADAPNHRARLLQWLPKLSQLDLTRVSQREKREAGLSVESSSSDSESETEEITAPDLIPIPVPAQSPRWERGSSRLTNNVEFEEDELNFEEDMMEMRQSMVQRSKGRLAESLSLHNDHLEELEKIRADSALPPSSVR